MSNLVEDRDKTREQLIQELAQARQRVDELESAEGQPENATQYQRLVESSLDWLWMVDLDGHHTFTNQAIESFLGYQPAEILGVSSYLFIHPDDWEPIQQLMERSIAQKTGWFKVTIRWLHKDGTIRFSESSGQPVLDQDGRLTGFSGIDRDITERKELEKELTQYRDHLEQVAETRTTELQAVITDHKQAEERLRILSLVVEQSDSPIVILDREHNVEYANKAFFEINQYTPEQVLGKRWQSFVSPQSSLRELLPEILDTTTANGLVWRGELSGVDNDGQPVWRQGTIFPIKDDHGELTHIVYFSEDITTRKQAEAALRESEARYRVLYGSMSEGAGLYEMIYTPSGEPEDYLVLDINPAYETITGLKREEVVGRKATEIFAGVRPSYLDLYAQVVASGEPTAFETYFPPWDKHFSVSVFSPGPGRFASTFFDITERKRTEEDLRQYTERLKILHDIDQAILKAQSPQATAEAALHYIRQLIPCERITVGLYDHVTGERVMLVSNIAGETVLGEGDRHPLDARWVDVLRQGKPLVVEDLCSFPDPWPSFRGLLDSGVCGLISTPLIVQGDLIGSLNLMATEPLAFREDQVEIALELADQLAIAIWQANLHEQIQHNAAQLEALRRITLDITAQLDLDTLLDALTRHAIAMLEADGGGLYLHRPERDVLEWVVIVGEGLSAAGTELKRGEGASGKIWETGKPLRVDYYSTWEGRSRTYDDLAIGATVGVPVRWGDEFLGVINATMAGTSKRTFSERDSQLLELLANQAAIAIHNAQLFDDNRRRADELDVLRRVTLDITAQLDLDNLLEVIVKSAVALLGVQGGGITLYRPDRDLLEWVVGINMNHIPIGLEIARGEGIAGQVWERGGPIIVDNYSTWDHHMAGFGDKHLLGAIAAPIQWGGDFLGTIAVAYVGTAARAFSEHDSQLLELFAHQAAIAIQNVRLFEEVQNHATTLEERVIERTSELAEAKQQTETILQNIGDAVVLTDINGNILYANPAWETLTGYTLTEVAQLNPRILKSEGTPAEVYETMWRTILGGDTWRGVLQNKRRDGTSYDCELTIAPVKDEKGQIDHFVGVMRDVTEERQLTAMKEQFIADAAHDLGNPVAVLQTSLYLLKKDPSQLNRRLVRFEHEINRLTALVKDLLTISRLDRKAIDTRMEKLDLNTIVGQVVESQSSLAIERKLTLSFDAEQNLPNILIDGKQIERVVVNLVGNALNYTAEGGEVQVRTLHEGDQIILQVKDTGIGIAPKDLRQIFERFYRGDQAKVTADGTGLGLPIAKEIIDLHGGQIEVESEEGQGSTFKVRLPAVR